LPNFIKQLHMLNIPLVGLLACLIQLIIVPLKNGVREPLINTALLRGSTQAMIQLVALRIVQYVRESEKAPDHRI